MHRDIHYIYYITAKNIPCPMREQNKGKRMHYSDTIAIRNSVFDKPCFFYTWGPFLLRC